MNLQSYDFGLRPQDQFQVLQRFDMNRTHLDILNRLFTPLIGAEAIGLYHFLHQFSSPEHDYTLTHYVFMNDLKINILEFRQQMDLLEGIGLVKTYVKHTEQYSEFIYELIQPPSAHVFFNDPMLSIFLYSEVDAKRFRALKQYFEKPQIDLSQFKQTTKKFTDVFKVPNTAVTIDTSQIKATNSYQGMDLSNNDFDFEMLRQMLDKHFISREIITQEAKQLITQLAVLYGLTPDAMKHVILNSITSAQQLSFEEMRKQARSYYLIEHDQQMPQLQLKDATTNQQEAQSQTSAQSEITSDDDWLNLLEETSPIDMLASWSESEPTASQKQLVEELIERQKLSFGVINILLQFVMLKEDMKLPKAYILEIASNWKKKGIKTAKQAYEYAQKVNQPKTQYTDYKSSKSVHYPRQRKLVSKEKTPKWLEERDKPKENQNIQSGEQDQQLEEDRQAFLNKLAKKWEEDSD